MLSEKHRTPSLKSFLKGKILVLGRGRKRERVGERDAINNSRHDFILFFCPPPFWQWEQGKSGRSSTEMSPGCHCLAAIFLVLCATLQEKWQCCFTIKAGIAFPAFKANWARFPFTSGKRLHNISRFCSVRAPLLSRFW